MTQFRPGREVMVVGVGLHPFGRFPEQSLSDLARDAVIDALRDSRACPGRRFPWPTLAMSIITVCQWARPPWRSWG